MRQRLRTTNKASPCASGLPPSPEALSNVGTLSRDPGPTCPKLWDSCNEPLKDCGHFAHMALDLQVVTQRQRHLSHTWGIQPSLNRGCDALSPEFLQRSSRTLKDLMTFFQDLYKQVIIRIPRKAGSLGSRRQSLLQGPRRYREVAVGQSRPVFGKTSVGVLIIRIGFWAPL